MHIFEYTTQLVITEDLRLITPEPAPEAANNYFPVQFLLAIKNGVGNQVNSHRWFISYLTNRRKMVVSGIWKDFGA